MSVIIDTCFIEKWRSGLIVQNSRVLDREYSLAIILQQSCESSGCQTGNTRTAAQCHFLFSMSLNHVHLVGPKQHNADSYLPHL